MQHPMENKDYRELIRMKPVKEVYRYLYNKIAAMPDKKDKDEEKNLWLKAARDEFSTQSNNYNPHANRKAGELLFLIRGRGDDDGFNSPRSSTRSLSSSPVRRSRSPVRPSRPTVRLSRSPSPTQARLINPRGGTRRMRKSKTSKSRRHKKYTHKRK